MNEHLCQIAVCKGHVAVVELLLSREEMEMERQDEDGWTALYYASRDDEPAALRRLLSQAGADPRIADIDGRT